MDVTGQIMIQLIPQNPVVKGSVTLNVTGIPESLLRFSWFKGPNTSSPYQILVYIFGIDPPTVPGPQNNTRISFFSNGSLHIRDLQVTDQGNYTVNIQTQKIAKDVFVNLTIHEPVTKPKITASTPQPKENDPFTLTCDTSQATTITWTRPGTNISSEAALSGGNKTLTFSRIRRGDSGKYQCTAQNLVSKDSSDPYTITVAYGPDNVHISTGAEFVKPGSSITLLCSADSLPSPEYQWKFNDTIKEEKSNQYGISNVVAEDEGTYTCVVRNRVTLRTANTSSYLNVTAEGQDFGNEGNLAMIIGVAVAGVLLLILIVAITFLFLIHKKRKTPSDPSSKMSDASRNGESMQHRESHKLDLPSANYQKSHKLDLPSANHQESHKIDLPLFQSPGVS
ncbi:cell adhesion molecule CEACAM8-like [Leptodactylus fuscus]|uniref:cell adhesion molecule CEACAM8-like n=1 Tax=Leptodactylus fuscus TaxID=238119 RepID=UPI003F4E9799